MFWVLCCMSLSGFTLKILPRLSTLFCPRALVSETLRLVRRRLIHLWRLIHLLLHSKEPGRQCTVSTYRLFLEIRLALAAWGSVLSRLQY